MTTEKKTLIEKLAEAALDCGYIQKDGKNEHFKYKFASMEAVADKVGPALAKRGIVFVPTELEPVAEFSTEKLFTIRVTWLVTDGSGPGLIVKSMGSGMDSGDKAISKAQTMARKYAQIGALNIAIGDDPEADASTDKATLDPEQAAISAQQANERAASDKLADEWINVDLKAIVDKANPEALLRWCDSNGYEWNTMHANARARMWRAIQKACERLDVSAQVAKKTLAESPAPSEGQ